MPTPMFFKTALAAWMAGLCLGTAHAEPDEIALGKHQAYSVSPDGRFTHEPYRVGSWSALDRVRGLRIERVAASPQPLPLARAAASPEIRYRYRNLGYTLDEYLERQRVTGLLIMKNGEILTERYRYGRQEDMRFLSFSMAKSVTAMLVGVAQGQGLIDLDAPAERYLKALEGSLYGQTTVRQLLRMSSGVKFTEVYNGQDDVSRLSASLQSTSPEAVLAYLRTLNERVAEPGSKFAYASAETEVLGRVLRAVTGKTLGRLTEEWLWRPLGAEHGAFWCTAGDGQPAAYFCFNASLRDWARLGLMLAQDGRVGDTQVVPRDFLLDGTDPARGPASHAPLRATPFNGYGYQFWLQPYKERTFVMQGIHGQAVFVQPATGIVMVHTAVFKGASGALDPEAHAERQALWQGVLQSLGGDTRRY